MYARIVDFFEKKSIFIKSIRIKYVLRHKRGSKWRCTSLRAIVGTAAIFAGIEPPYYSIEYPWGAAPVASTDAAVGPGSAWKLTNGSRTLLIELEATTNPIPFSILRWIHQFPL